MQRLMDIFDGGRGSTHDGACCAVTLDAAANRSFAVCFHFYSLHPQLLPLTQHITREEYCLTTKSTTCISYTIAESWA